MHLSGSARPARSSAALMAVVATLLTLVACSASPPGAAPTPLGSARATAPKPGTIIDGFTVGSMLICSGGTQVSASSGASCGGDLGRATAVLDAREPGHAAVVSVAKYTDGSEPGPIDVTGPGPVPTEVPLRHPGLIVYVFVYSLADGTTRATGVACTDYEIFQSSPAAASPIPSASMESFRPASCVGVPAYPN